MENATKALLIAAAVLIAILIISLTIIIYRNGQEAVTGADMSEAETTQFNSKFTTYEGTKESTAQVNALLNTVLQHNLQETEAGTNRTVTVTVTGANTGAGVNANSITRVTGSNYYKIKCTLGDDGLVKSIAVTKN